MTGFTFWEMIASLAWPGVFVFCIWLMQDQIRTLLANRSRTSMTFFNREVLLKADEDGLKIRDILSDIDQDIKDLPDDAKELLNTIRSWEGRTSVRSYRANFERDDDTHKLLLLLTHRKLIMPAEGGSWEADKHPVVTRFTKLITRIAPERLRPAGHTESASTAALDLAEGNV